MISVNAPKSRKGQVGGGNKRQEYAGQFTLSQTSWQISLVDMYKQAYN